MKPNLIALLLIILLAVTGCGGSGGGGGPVAGDFPVTATISWPDRGRDVSGPASALSLKVTVNDAGDAGTDLVFSGNRDINDDAHIQSFTGTAKTKGTYAFHIDFYAAADGAGDVVATAGGTIVVDGATSLPSVGFTSKIATVAIPAGQMIANGGSGSVEAEVKDAEGNLLAITPGSFTWTVASGTEHLTYAAGVFTGVSRGRPTVTVAVDGTTSEAATVGVYDTLQILNATAETTYQDVDGSWLTPMDGESSTSKLARITNEAGKYAVLGSPNAYYMTLTESNVVDLAAPVDPTIARSTTTFTNVAKGDFIYQPLNSYTIAQGTSANANVITMPGGPIAAYLSRSGNGLKGIIHPSPGETETLDFQGAEAQDLVNLTVDAPGATTTAAVLTGDGFAPLPLPIDPTDKFTSKVFPTSGLHGGLYAVQAFFGDNKNSTVVEMRTTATGTIQFPTLSNPLTITAASVAAGASGGQIATLTFPFNEVATVFQIGVITNDPNVNFRAIVSPGYLGGSSTATFTTPDLATILPTGKTVVSASVYETTRGTPIKDYLAARNDLFPYVELPDVPGFTGPVKEIDKFATHTF